MLISENNLNLSIILYLIHLSYFMEGFVSLLRLLLDNDCV